MGHLFVWALTLPHGYVWEELGMLPRRGMGWENHLQSRRWNQRARFFVAVQRARIDAGKDGNA